MRLKTGVQGLDELIEGGLIKNNVYMVSGAPGSGRTTLGIQFLVEGAKQNNRGLFVAFTETPTNIIKYMSRYNFDLVNHVKSKRIFFMDGTQEIFEDDSKKKSRDDVEIFDLGAESTSTKTIFEKLEPIIQKTKIERLVVDSTTALSFLTRSRETGPKQIVKYLNLLKQMNVTVLVLTEHFDSEQFNLEHYFCQGIIHLHNFTTQSQTKMSRGIQIVKLSGTKHDTKHHPMAFSAGGIVVTGED